MLARENAPDCCSPDNNSTIHVQHHKGDFAEFVRFSVSQAVASEDAFEVHEGVANLLEELAVGPKIQKLAV